MKHQAAVRVCAFASLLCGQSVPHASIDDQPSSCPYISPPEATAETAPQLEDEVLLLELSDVQVVDLDLLAESYDEVSASLLSEIAALQNQIETANPLIPGYMEFVAELAGEKARLQQSLERLIAERTSENLLHIDARSAQ